MAKGQSEIISVILLILLVVGAVAIIYAFVVPYITENLSSGDCVNVQTKISIEDNPKYTCYNSTSVHIQIKIGDINESISGFEIELGGASSKAYMVTVSDHKNVSVYGYGSTFELPGKNEARTYVIKTNEKPEYVRVYGILENGKLCGMSDSIAGANLGSCKI
jgi:FlaG/FlaF family flagellin (archaellin)